MKKNYSKLFLFIFFISTITPNSNLRGNDTKNTNNQTSPVINETLSSINEILPATTFSPKEPYFQNQTQLSPISMLLLLCLKAVEEVEDTAQTKGTVEALHQNFDQLINEIEAGHVNFLKASFETAKISLNFLKMFIANHKVETNLSILIILITAFCLDQLCNNGTITTILINQTENVAQKIVAIAIKAGIGIKNLTGKLFKRSTTTKEDVALKLA